MSSSQEAAEAQLEELRRMGSEGRLRVAFELSRRAREQFEAGVRSEHPEMTDREITREVVRRLYGVILPR
jgi:hypothetical protein